ncbi:MAG: response regulator, partial [Gammaproteobacteria bacterium]
MDQDANILVVDDDVTICNLLDRYLTAVGYRVKTVTNGEEALELIETQSFDLVLLDILMPEVTGRDVLIKVRQHHSPSELPIIMVTGISDSKAIVD